MPNLGTPRQSEFEQSIRNACFRQNYNITLREYRSGFNTETKTGFMDYILTFEREPSESLLKQFAFEVLVAEDEALGPYRGRIIYRVSRVRLGHHVLDYPVPHIPEPTSTPLPETDEDDDIFEKAENRAKKIMQSPNWANEVDLDSPGTPIKKQSLADSRAAPSNNKKAKAIMKHALPLRK